MALQDYAANTINTDVTNFDGNLTSADDHSQKAFDTLDDYGRNVSITTGSYTALSTDDVIVCNTTGSMTITLPAASGGASRGVSEWILKQNVSYLLKLTNLTATNNYASVHLDWYEHTDKH